jgi:predicted transcriptional regulator of viral defense system
LEELERKTGLSSNQLKDIVSFWERKGILYESSTGHYSVREELSGPENGGMSAVERVHLKMV